jgi:hypothetical protein
MIGTRYPEIFTALTEEFGPREVRTRMLGNRQLSYVTARTVMNRLDSVIGPENWWDEYTPLQNGILCKLTVRLPDGEEICKSDAGGHAGMSDEGDDEKSGFSDAFKRAAVKFGIGRHLYGEGTPRFNAASAPLTLAVSVSRPNGHGNGNGNAKAKSSTVNGSSRAARGRSSKPERAKVSEQATATEPVKSAALAFDEGPRTSKEFYEYVKSLDPDGSNGTRDFLVKWGREQGYPSLVKEWTDTQAQAGYERLKAHLDASTDD